MRTSYWSFSRTSLIVQTAGQRWSKTVSIRMRRTSGPRTKNAMVPVKKKQDVAMGDLGEAEAGERHEFCHSNIFDWRQDGGCSSKSTCRMRDNMARVDIQQIRF